MVFFMDVSPLCAYYRDYAGHYQQRYHDDWQRVVQEQVFEYYRRVVKARDAARDVYRGGLRRRAAFVGGEEEEGYAAGDGRQAYGAHRGVGEGPDRRRRRRSAEGADHERDYDRDDYHNEVGRVAAEDGEYVGEFFLEAEVGEYAGRGEGEEELASDFAEFRRGLLYHVLPAGEAVRQIFPAFNHREGRHEYRYPHDERDGLEGAGDIGVERRLYRLSDGAHREEERDEYPEEDYERAGVFAQLFAERLELVLRYRLEAVVLRVEVDDEKAVGEDYHTAAHEADVELVAREFDRYRLHAEQQEHRGRGREDYSEARVARDDRRRARSRPAVALHPRDGDGADRRGVAGAGAGDHAEERARDCRDVARAAREASEDAVEYLYQTVDDAGALHHEGHEDEGHRSVDDLLLSRVEQPVLRERPCALVAEHSADDDDDDERPEHRLRHAPLEYDADDKDGGDVYYQRIYTYAK